MATDVILVNSGQNTLADTIQDFYTSPASGAGTLIAAFTATNNTGANQSYKAYIYDSTGGLIDAVIPLKIVVRNRFDLGAGIVNHLIPPGGSLRMESSAADSIAFRVTGKEL
jgi:hypothetical protein